MNIWEIVILRSIESRRGSCASTKEIYELLESGDYINLNKAHLRKTVYGGRPAYQHQVRSHLINLLQTGDLYRPLRATYCLTQKGIKRVKKIIV